MEKKESAAEQIRRFFKQEYEQNVLLRFFFGTPGKRTASVIALTLTILCALFLFTHDPLQFRWYPKCLFHQLTGFYCAGCGGTRAFYALLHGDLHGVLRNNPMLLPALIPGIVLLIRPELFRKPALYGGIFLVLLLFMILRNLPWEPLTLLAPH